MYRIFCCCFLPLLAALTACTGSATTADGTAAAADSLSRDTLRLTGSVERISPLLDRFVAPGAQLEILAEGFDWTEGPLWLPEQRTLLFSDIPPNRIYQWNEDEGLRLYLEPSGYTDTVPRKGEPGANGLLLNAEGQLVMAQHGDRRMARMEAPLDAPAPRFATLADRFENKRFNSPNDAAYHPNGSLYFTDPPYGLEKNMNDPAKEIDYQGVYRLQPNGTVSLMTKELSRPNGIAFSPDGQTAYVANSDPERAIWMAYDVTEAGDFTNGRIFYDATSKVGQAPGLPDGLKVHPNGTLFATGPGGVHVFSAEGEALGLIRTGQATSNVAFNADHSALYITADMYLLRLTLK